MDKYAIRRRNRHAIQQLKDRGALKSGALPPGLRLAMALFPNLRAPYYGSRGAYTLILGALFGLPMGGFVGWILAMDGQYSAWWAIVLGLLAGLAFGWFYTGYLDAVHRRMQLTPWDELDNAAHPDTPEDAETFKEVEGDFVRRFSRRI